MSDEPRPNILAEWENYRDAVYKNVLPLPSDQEMQLRSAFLSGAFSARQRLLEAAGNEDAVDAVLNDIQTTLQGDIISGLQNARHRN